MDKIVNMQETVSESQTDISIEIRKLQLISDKHRWSDNLKVLQAKYNKWGKKEYEEKIHNIEHNFQHLMNNLESDEFDLHFQLINQVDAHEDAIEVLLKFHQKKIEQEEFLQNNPAESFINRVAKERVDIKKRKRERIHKLKEKLKTKEQIQEEKKKEILEQEKQRRREEFEKLKEKRLKQREEYDKAFKDLNSSMTSPMPLYKKLEKEYEKKFVMPDLERKKMALKTIRSMHEPLNYDNLKEHARAYSLQRAEKLQKFREEKERKMLQNIQNFEKNRHRSMFMDKIMMDDREAKEQELIKTHELHDLYDKRKNYANLVQQMHKPVVSRKKQVELEVRKAGLRTTTRANMLYPNRSQGNQLSEVTSVHSGSHSPVNSVGKSEYRGYFSENRKLKPIRIWKENDLKPKIKPKLKPIVVDYLLEKRIIKEEKEGYEDGSKIYKQHKPIEWKTLVEKMDAKDRVEFLREKAKIIEEKVMFKNELNKYENFDPAAQVEADEMLIDALKARMTALEDVSAQV